MAVPDPCFSLRKEPGPGLGAVSQATLEGQFCLGTQVWKAWKSIRPRGRLPLGREATLRWMTGRDLGTHPRMSSNNISPEILGLAQGIPKGMKGRRVGKK